jgi:hypothetical protein
MLFLIGEDICIPKRRLQMDNEIQSNVKPRKEWVAPELKKVDIEQITAGGGPNPSNNDAVYGSS